VKSSRSISFGAACCCGSCLTIFVSGFAIFLASASTVLLVLSINSSAAHLVSSSTRSISPRIAFNACCMSFSDFLTLG